LVVQAGRQKGDINVRAKEVTQNKKQTPITSEISIQVQ